MRYILIHKGPGVIPPEAMASTLDMAKQLNANPQAFVPGGKLVSSHYAIGAQAIYCVWDVSNAEALSSLLRNMSLAGWHTDVIPVESAEIALPNMEKAYKDLMAMMARK